MFTVYTKQNCAQCTMAKNLLASKQLEFSTVEIDYGTPIVGEKISREDFMSKFPGVRELPMVVENDTTIGGYKSLVVYLKDR